LHGHGLASSEKIDLVRRRRWVLVDVATAGPTTNVRLLRTARLLALRH
jgi:hypothetical protein